MKKQVTKIISVLLVATILCSCSFAFAANDIDKRGPGDITVQWTNTDFLAAGLDISSWGKATCGFDIELTNSTDTAKVYMYLQRYKNGGWRNVTSWSATGSGFFSGSKKYYVTKGYNYRVAVTAYVYNSSGVNVECATQYSPTKYY